jgi:hypothetical protein
VDSNIYKIAGMNKETISESILVENKTIIEFYRKYKCFDFEEVNLILISLLKNIAEGIDIGLLKSVSTQILEQCVDNSQKIDMMSIRLNKLNSDIMIKIMDVKKDYIDEVKTIITLNDISKNDIYIKQIENITELFIHKTNSIIIPNISDNMKKEVSEKIYNYQTTLLLEIEKIKNNDLKIEQYITNFDRKFEQNISCMTNNIVSTNTKNDIILDDIREFISKYKISAIKGQLGENRLENTLNKMFPSDEIINVSGIKESGDFHLKRINQDTILIETKEYDRNVNRDEVDKFIRDCSTQNTHGIFLSHNSGIANKKNFQIELNNNKVLIYIHYAEYSPEKIQTAIDIIDSLSEKIKDTNPHNIHTIPVEVLDEINQEYQASITQKNIILDYIKETNKKLISLIDDIKLPKLDKYLNHKYSLVNKGIFICEQCNKIFDSQKGLSSHKKKHKTNDTDDTTSTYN